MNDELMNYELKELHRGGLKNMQERKLIRLEEVIIMKKFEFFCLNKFVKHFSLKLYMISYDHFSFE